MVRLVGTDIPVLLMAVVGLWVGAVVSFSGVGESGFLWLSWREYPNG